LLLAVAEAGIDRELALLETLVEQIFAKLGRRAALDFAGHGKVEHHEDPHEPVTAELGERHGGRSAAGMVAEGFGSDSGTSRSRPAISIGVGGKGVTSVE